VENDLDLTERRTGEIAALSGRYAPEEKKGECPRTGRQSVATRMIPSSTRHDKKTLWGVGKSRISSSQNRDTKKNHCTKGRKVSVRGETARGIREKKGLLTIWVGKVVMHRTKKPGKGRQEKPDFRTRVKEERKHRSGWRRLWLGVGGQDRESPKRREERKRYAPIKRKGLDVRKNTRSCGGERQKPQQERRKRREERENRKPLLL